MEFEWDQNKRALNLEKHGIDFMDAARIFSGPRFVRRCAHPDEKRWICVGALKNQMIAVVYTLRGGKIRIISARKARQNERELYRDMVRKGKTPSSSSG